MKSRLRLVRAIDGHQFFTMKHQSKLSCELASARSYSPCLEDGFWVNFNSTLGYQEDVHELPPAKSIKRIC